MSLEFLILDRFIIIGAAFILDLILGDPMWLCNIISHPAILIGKLISKWEKIIRSLLPKTKKSEQIGGFLIVLAVIIISVLPTILVVYGAYKINHYLGMAVEIFICYEVLAVKSLKDESMKVYYALKNGTLDDGRRAVSYIVGRDTKDLTKEGVIKAAVETVAENTTDGVVSPLIFMAIGGAAGGIFYKAINTMDSMIGYKNDKYMFFGTCAARLDDIANFVPSRITAILMIISSFFLGFDGKNAFKIWIRDRLNHKSPNSAQTEAVCAGALGVQLAGNAYYFGKLYEKPTIGDKKREIEEEDIKNINKIMYGSSILAVILCLIFCVFI